MKLNLKILHNLNIKERLIIAAMILAGTGYLIYSLIIPPAFYHYKIARRQLYVQKHLIESRKKKTEKLLRLKDDFEDLEKESFKRKKMFFTDNEALDFLNNLDKWACETGNNLEKIKPMSVKTIFNSELGKTLCYKNNIVEVIMRGKYNSLLQLFKRFTGYEKLLGISQIDLKPAKEDALVLNAKISLNIYMLSPLTE
ncbi:MAG: hypothetical protein KAT96_00090 [Candidatus Omnitrophica bacterium]|nr:hypothetical protein [Candidatus Omnitrophota bacterium]